MSILLRARADWERFSQSAFDLDITMKVSDEAGAETVTIKALLTRIAVTIETDGQDVIGDKFRLTFSENLVNTTNPLYPIRNSDGLVAMNNHRVNGPDSTGVIHDLVIKNVYPDSTVGMIICDLSTYKTHPVAPSDLIVSDIETEQFTATLTSNSNSVESGFQWEISTDNFVNDIVVAGTTGKNILTFDYTGLTQSTLYSIRALAIGGKNSEYSAIVQATTAAAFEPESELVFARNPTLNDNEKIWIDDMIIRAKAAGTDNYAKTNEIFIFGQDDGDFKIGFKTATATVFGGILQGPTGIEGNATNAHAFLNFNQSTDAPNSAIEDTMDSFFLKDVGTIGSGDHVLGVIDGPNEESRHFKLNSTQLSYSSNAGRRTYNAVYVNNTWYGYGREDINSKAYVEGVQVDSQSRPVAAIPDGSMVILALNNVTGSIANFSDVIVGAYSNTANIGFDKVAEAEYMRILIACFISKTRVMTLAAANIIINAA